MMRPEVLDLMQLGSAAFSFFQLFALFGCGVGFPIWDLEAWGGHANCRFLDFWIFGWSDDLDFWFSGFLFFWFSGFLVFCFFGFLVFCFFRFFGF